MALKINQAKLGKFGSLTSTAQARADKSIFGKNACNLLATSANAFNSLSMNDNGSYDIFSDHGRANVDREYNIITGNDKPQKSHKIEINEKALMMVRNELQGDSDRKVVSLG